MRSTDFGRIGRQAFKALGERHPDLDIVAINDLFDSDTNAHLLKYDSNYGTFDGTIEATDMGLVVNGHEIKGCSEREWTDLPWGELGIDLVIEATGVGTARAMAEKQPDGGRRAGAHLRPGRRTRTSRWVLGVNDERYDPEQHRIISNGVLHDERAGTGG